MSKQMTPCEKLGYKVGDRFKVVSDCTNGFGLGEIVKLISKPRDGHYDMSNGWITQTLFDGQFVAEYQEQKLKPAKQALADAIHQNGGWPNHCDCNFATSNDRHLACFFTERPVKGRFTEWSWWVRVAVLSRTAKPLPNWHQCILSRDEYFTAYPEQVKVEVDNETEHKVEVEMKSESEMTIKVGDWHKNGELPPVGEVCIFDPNGRTEFFDEKAIGAIGKEVSIISHVKFKGAVGSVAVFMCDSDGVAIVRTASETCFRPLRTERDKAIDEMASSVLAVMNGDLQRRLCEDLYDAGYRKEVK